MPYLEKADGKIYYETAGEGVPLVALRGLGRSIRHWLGYETELARHFQVITLDARGIGRTTVPAKWTNSLNDLADDVAEVLDELKIDAAHILGVSLGGMITLAMGLRHPERCLSLITVNTSIGGQKTLRMSVPAARAVFGGATLFRERLHEMLCEVLVGPGLPADRRAEIIEKFYEIERLEGLNEKAVPRQLLSALRFNVKGKLHKLKVPTMVIYGTEDQFVPNINSRKLVQHIPHAKLVPIHGAGHELTMDYGPALTEAINAWTKELVNKH